MASTHWFPVIKYKACKGRATCTDRQYERVIMAGKSQANGFTNFFDGLRENMSYSAATVLMCLTGAM